MKKYKISYSHTAIRDLDRVYDEVFMASNDYDTARDYVNDLLNEVEKRSDHPEAGSPLYYEDLFTGYYFVVFKAYIAFYRVESDKMLVDRVLFGASDYLKVLFRK